MYTEASWKGTVTTSSMQQPAVEQSDRTHSISMRERRKEIWETDVTEDFLLTS